MKKFAAIMMAVMLVGWSSGAQAETTFRLGGGINKNSARSTGDMVFGVHGALDFSLGESPWTIGVFGEGNFDAPSGKPLLAGVNVFYKMSLGSSHSKGLDPKIYVGPSVGLVSVDVGERKTALHLGGTVGAEFPLSKNMGLFGNAKYSWANDSGGIELMKGVSAHVGVMFNLGN